MASTDPGALEQTSTNSSFWGQAAEGVYTGLTHPYVSWSLSLETGDR